MASFYSIGTAKQAAQMGQLHLKWQQRKENPYLPKEGEDPEITRIREEMKKTKESNNISAIDAKLKAGAELSSEEMEYLKENAPDLYEKALEVRRERAEYKKALERCKTKDEVQRLNMTRMQGFFNEAKAISSNPNLSAGKKLELLDQVQRKMMGILKEHRMFISSPKYAALPTEEEKEEKKKSKSKEKPSVDIQRAQMEMPWDKSQDELLRRLNQELEKEGIEMSFEIPWQKESDIADADVPDPISLNTYDPSGNLTKAEVASEPLPQVSFSKKI